MSPRVLKDGELVFWFHSYDVALETRASVHVGKVKAYKTTPLTPKSGLSRMLRSLDLDGHLR